MTAKILIGPSASGKTRYCIQRILEILQEIALGPVWVIVPDQLQAYAFRGRLSGEGGAMGVHIGTFGDLYREILWQADRPVPVATEPMIQRFLQDGVRKVAAQGGFGYYGPIVGMPGFLRILAATINELKLARIWPEKFQEWSKTQPEGLAEIARVYVGHQALLQELGWADSAGVSWLATESLENDPTLLSDWPLLVVDGFDSYNGAQRAALRLLGERSQELLITLPGRNPMDRVAHRRFARSLAQLRSDWELEVEYLPETTHLPDPLAHLERTLFKAKTQKIPRGDQVMMLEVRSPREESREALRWIKSLILRNGLLPHECAIVTPDPERYRAFLREAGVEFGVPLRFTHGESLASSPAIAALLDLLALPLADFPRRLTLEAVRAPYFDLTEFGLSREDAYPLEVLSRQGLVIQGLAQWEETLTGLGQVADQQAINEGAHELWEGLHTFAKRLRMPDEASTQQWVRWLEDLLVDIRYLQVDQSAGDEASFLGLRNVLRALVLGEAVAGEKPMRAHGFMRMLRSALEAANYQERVNWTESMVLVLRVLEARGLRYKAVAVLGLSEGLFPEVEREDPFLRDKMRESLGLEKRLQREQAGLFYQVITRADNYLLLTRPTLADDGERWESSPFWVAVEALFEEDPKLLRLGAPRAMADAASGEEALYWAVRRKALPSTYAQDLLKRWNYLQDVAEILAARQAKKAAGPFEGVIREISSLLGVRYGPEHLWSSSRLEKYTACPQRFYVESVLELETKDAPEYGVSAAQLGLMLHEVLEQYYRETTEPEKDMQRLAATAAEIFADAPERYEFRPSALWEIEQEQFIQALTKTVLELEEIEGDWKPMAFERAFGLSGEEALVMKINGESILIRGLIDRLDQRADGQLRIVDYKTGSTQLDKKDLVIGHRLQLPIYALAARDALHLGNPTEGFYWGILKARAGNLRLSTFEAEHHGKSYSGPEGAIELATEHVRAVVHGVRAGQFPPIPPRGGCPEYCAAASWCWRYTPRRW